MQAMLKFWGGIVSVLFDDIVQNDQVKAIFDWQVVEDTLREMWKYFTWIDGAQCVMMNGMSQKPQSFAIRLVSPTLSEYQREIHDLEKLEVS